MARGSVLAALLGGCAAEKVSGVHDSGTPVDDTGALEAFMFVRNTEGRVTDIGVTTDLTSTAETVYTITTTAPAGSTLVDITQTGDPALHHERHDGFDLDGENPDHSWTYRLVLQAVDDGAQVITNETTLIHRVAGDDGYSQGFTWHFSAISEDGSQTDCVVTGHDPGYYADACGYTE